MDYKNSKIYKLQHNNGSFYIGSTCSELRKRLYTHKGQSKLYPDRKVYKYINGEWDNIRIILIEAFECTNKDELRKKEDEYIKKELENELCLNYNRVVRVEGDNSLYNKKHYKNNKDKKLEYSKQYYNSNKAKINEYQRHYRQSKKKSNDTINGK